MCSSCDNGNRYSKIGVKSCVECLPMDINLTRIIIVFTVFLIVLWLMVHSANKEAEEYALKDSEKSSFKLDKCLSIYLKI